MTKAIKTDSVMQTKRHVKPYVVGIGASAGGLEALEDFFSQMPLTGCLAFVVIQHLDPTHKALLKEILQRSTSMKVQEATNQMNVLIDHVYVIPPNKDLSILNNSLVLLEPSAPRGLRLPINFFFCSLADDQKDHAIAVILSGMGSDGTLGLRAIKESGGLILVQSPESAKFDAMPRSAISADLADFTGSPKELTAHITSYLKHPSFVDVSEEKSKTDSIYHGALEQIIVLLREQTGNDFSLYKKNTIVRRTERRMGFNKINSIIDYVRYLRANPQEIELLYKELLIGVTSFFRDADIWEALRVEAFPRLLKAYPEGKTLRAWVPAVSTGEEAYSLAMLFMDVIKDLNPEGHFSLKIFATDLDEDAISIARQGLYPAHIEADVSRERLTRYFSPDGKGYRVLKNIREMVIFAPQNIIKDPPFTKIDILTCRNLLIYLGSELQRKLIVLFHYALNSDGILMLGNAETIGSYTKLFTALDKKSHIYFSTDNYSSLPEINFSQKVFPVMSSFEAEATNDLKVTKPVTDLKSLADQLLLQNFAPAAVLTNTEGDILYINGRTGKYLEPAAGKANWNINAMAREGLRHELNLAISRAMGHNNPVHINGLTIDINGRTQTINLAVQAISSQDALNGTLMIAFYDVATSSKTLRKKQGSNQELLLQELDQSREQLKNLRETMQSTQEELKAANEELQSTNEELQSTNEELTTSKEEMQSLNEELQTVNAELQSKVDDLSWVNNDMANLLNSTEIATIFLDNKFKVRRFTTHIVQLFKLIASDVGRPLSDIATDLDYDLLQHDSKEVLRTLVFIEKQVTTKDGRWFKVRIMPYRTQDNVIDGVVITFTDISDFKVLEAKLRHLKVKE